MSFTAEPPMVEPDPGLILGAGPTEKGNNEFCVARHGIWQKLTISGFMHQASSSDDRWWYRVQPADGIVASELLDTVKVSGRYLRTFARSCFTLPQERYHIAWSPQWVPAESISGGLKDAFWSKVPTTFWSLIDTLGEDVIWREEVEQLITLSYSTSQHLCIRKGCTTCETRSSCEHSVDDKKPEGYVSNVVEHTDA